MSKNEVKKTKVILKTNPIPRLKVLSTKRPPRLRLKR